MLAVKNKTLFVLCARRGVEEYDRLHEYTTAECLLKLHLVMVHVYRVIVV